MWGSTVRGSWRSNITEIFWPPLLWPSALCLSRSPGMLNRRPSAHAAGWWLSLLHLISIFSGPQLIRASNGPFSLMWLSLPHLVYNSVQTPTVCNSTGQNSTELYNLSTPTGSLKSLPVHQSMSVPCEFFSSSHFISQFPPTRFPLITAIRMCHFLPVHHLEWHF